MMGHRAKLVFAAFSITALLQAGPYESGELLIQFGKSFSSESQKEFHANQNFEVIHDFGDGLVWIRFPAELDAKKAAKDIQLLPGVQFAEPNWNLKASRLKVTVSQAPEDEWRHLNRGKRGKTDADMDSFHAWDVQRSAKDTIVAVVDTGIDLTHEDLIENLWVNKVETRNGIDDDKNGLVDDLYGYNFIRGSGAPHDDAGNGTYAAGLIGAMGSNKKGIVFSL